MAKLFLLLLLITNLVMGGSDDEVISTDFMREMVEYYGPKNAQPKIDTSYIKQLTDDKLEKILLRWYGLDEEFKANHQHWHQGNEDISFENFISKINFAPLDKNYLNVTGVCTKHYESPTSFIGKVLKKLKLYSGRKSYTDIRFYSGDDQWFDINQHNDKTYSITFWDWINTIAIKAKNNTYISHNKPRLYRWNDKIPHNVIDEIFKQGQFELYIELNMLRVYGILMTGADKLKYKIPPKFNLAGKVNISNIKELKECFK